MVDERNARRERKRRQVRRRRILAGGALLVAAAAIVAVAVTAMAGGETDHNERGRGSNRIPTQSSTTPKADWRPYRGPVPILEYHVLGAAPADEPYPDLYVTRPDFHKQMNWLDEHAYEAVTLEQVEEAWYQGATLPPKPVVVSFDDGYRPQFTYALPELRRHGWAGVLNLKAEGSDLYPSNVEAMIAAGWEIAAHTINHLDLTELDAAQLKEEVAGSRAILRRDYGVPVKNFCYPAGRFDATVIAAVRAAGYAGATTEIAGYADREHPYELDRYEILGSQGVAGMVSDLR
ncbi:MAG TPA: polysaccharide deacetylase family protein [Solirubrobacterales bacterium]|nr:polysaccharide deacetylase family protein [Solirubrobacterales bacterium]